MSNVKPHKEYVAMVHRLILPFILLVASGLLWAADNLVFGLALGEPLTISECERASYGYSFGTKVVCYKRLFGREKEKTPVVSETVQIRFPFSESPSLVSGASISALVLDGRLEGLGFNTAGISNQESVLNSLKNKYGEPQLLVPTTVQNRMGASFKTFSASWNVSGIVISFLSVTDSLDSGLVTIDTKKGSEYRDEQLEELTKDKRPL